MSLLPIGPGRDVMLLASMGTALTLNMSIVRKLTKKIVSDL